MAPSSWPGPSRCSDVLEGRPACSSVREEPGSKGATSCGPGPGARVLAQLHREAHAPERPWPQHRGPRRHSQTGCSCQRVPGIQAQGSWSVTTLCPFTVTLARLPSTCACWSLLSESLPGGLASVSLGGHLCLSPAPGAFLSGPCLPLGVGGGQLWGSPPFPAQGGGLRTVLLTAFVFLFKNSLCLLLETPAGNSPAGRRSPCNTLTLRRHPQFLPPPTLLFLDPLFLACFSRWLGNSAACSVHPATGHPASLCTAVCSFPGSD